MVARRTDRKIFATRAQFYLACLGYITGYGSFVTFPVLCIHGGGAAYLVAYLVTLVIFGIPIHYLELAVGQLTRLGPLHSLAKFCPILKGTGVTIVIVSAIIACYHSVIIAWCLHYLFHSFANPLPWGSCDNPWNSPECTTFVNNSVPGEDYNANYAYIDTRSYSTPALPSQQYHTNNVLKISNGIDDPGEFNLPLLGFLLLTWMICFAGLSFGVKSIGKAVYVTVSLPYLIMVVLLIRATTLPGAGQGLLYLFKPQWSKLLNPGVWYYAFKGHIHSFAIGTGVMITYSSYSSKLNNVYHATMCFSLVSIVFKVIAGIIQLSFLGALSESLGLPILETYGRGQPAMFSDIPHLFTIIPLSNLWSVLFFLMVTLLAVNVQFGVLEVVCTTFADGFHEKLKRLVKWYRPIVAFVVCGISFLFSIPYVTGAGYYLILFLGINLETPLTFVVTFELMAVILGYGSSRLARMLGYTSGIRTYHTYPWIWIFIIPILTSVVTSYRSWDMQNVSSFYSYPFWMTIIKYLLIIFTSIWVLVGFIHEMCTNKGTCKEKFVKACKPTFIPAGMMDSNRRDAIPMMPIYTETASTATIVTEPLTVDVVPV